MSTTFSSSSSAVEKLRKLLLLLLLANALFCLLFLLTSFSFFDSTDPDELSSEDEDQDQWTSSPVHLPLAADYLRVLLSHSGRLFLLEPFYLVAQLNSQQSLSLLKKRFGGFPENWPSTPPPSPNASAPQHLSVGLFADHFADFEEDLLDQSSQLLHNFQPFSEATSPAAAADRLTSVTYRNAEGSLYLHLVLFYRSEGHFWARFARSWKAEKAEEEPHQQPQPPTIFDPFHLLHINGIAFPADIEHYLSQLPTARYLECTGESRQWMAEKGVSSASKTEAAFRLSLTGMKTLARHLRMEVWIASGTLLGWYRQCSVTPYTTDTDFASWSAYIDGESLQSTSDLFKKETALAGTHLRLLQRFGTPSTRSLEYSFNTVKDGEKVDLFFVYRNRTSVSGEQREEFLSPLHDVQKGRFIFQRYPSYSLCSVLLLGLKVLAPCTPREVIIAEYGPQWRKPIAKWDYTSSPVNFVSQGWQRWSSLAASNETQYESF